MASIIRLSVKGLEQMQKRLNAQEREVINAMAKAHSKVASEAVKELKQGLRNRAGRTPRDPDYANSPKGELPYMHSGALRDSIGYNLLRAGKQVFSEVGSGYLRFFSIKEVKYAKWLEGNDGQGIRPFLWKIKDIYNAKNIIKKFNEYYRPKL